jgi:glycosyltransferase involved in cell wall biosynthesis
MDKNNKPKLVKEVLNIYIFNTSLNQGGAAIASYRLKKGLENRKECRPFSIVKSDNIKKEKNCIVPETKNSMVWQEVLNQNVFQNRSQLSTTYYDVYYRSNIENIYKIFKNKTGIINIHWVANFVSMQNLQELSELNLPMVWTLHDEAAYTGGCHYTAGCNKFQKDCYMCPQLEKDNYHIPKITLKQKQQIIPKDLVVVTPSHWLAKQAKKSALFKDHDIQVIPNGIDINIFKPHDKKKVRESMGISEDTFLMLFGAQNTIEKRKGFHLLLEVIGYLKKNKKFKKLISAKKLKIVTFGRVSRELEDTGLSIENVGYIEDESKLSEIYSASDLFVLPSLEDNLPNTMLESMASGTPVLGFNIGGLPDVIKHNKNGILIPPFDTAQMAEKLMNYYDDGELRLRLQEKGRQTIVKQYTIDHQARKYNELFSSLERKSVVSKAKIPTMREGIGKYALPQDLYHLYHDTCEQIANERNILRVNLRNTRVDFDHYKQAAEKREQILIKKVNDLRNSHSFKFGFYILHPWKILSVLKQRILKN